MQPGNGKVLVAMSGGVDSSTAAALLVRQGCDVVGVTLRLPAYGAADEAHRPCCGVQNVEDARAVAQKLGIPFYVLDYREKFERTVLDYFRREYLRGRTPNPCVRCNEWIKFGLLMEQAAAMDCARVATGHYARAARNEQTGRFELHAGRGEQDQSYFLFSLSQEQLARALFPVGGLTKAEVRALAGEFGLPVRDKPASQDLCFLASGGYEQVLRRERPDVVAPGDIVHVSGRVLGRHEGIAGYTVGQRRGLRIAWAEPLYVVALDAAQHRVIVGEKEHVMRRALVAGEVNWVALDAPREAFRAEVRIRHRHGPAPAMVEPLAGGPCSVAPAGAQLQGGRVRVQFDEPQEAPTPGQCAVFYRDGCVLGGGFIEACAASPL